MDIHQPQVSRPLLPLRTQWPHSAASGQPHCVQTVKGRTAHTGACPPSVTGAVWHLPACFWGTSPGLWVPAWNMGQRGCPLAGLSRKPSPTQPAGPDVSLGHSCFRTALRPPPTTQGLPATCPGTEPRMMHSFRGGSSAVKTSHGKTTASRARVTGCRTPAPPPQAWEGTWAPGR